MQHNPFKHMQSINEEGVVSGFTLKIQHLFQSQTCFEMIFAPVIPEKSQCLETW